MTDIVVIRGLGDREGEDIVEALLSEDSAALSRGRAELDQQATAKVERTIEIPYETGVEMGQLVEVADSLSGAVYRGKVIDIKSTLQGDPPSAMMHLTLLVPTDFYG